MTTKRILSTAVLVAIFAVPSMAQSTKSFDNHPESWWQAVEYQITTSLDSPIEAVKVAQMKNAIAMTTLYRDRIDLTAAVPAIIAFHQKCDDPELKAVAVAALQSIDSMQGSRYLRKKVKAKEMEAARTAMIAVLSAYTGGAPVAAL